MSKKILTVLVTLMLTLGVVGSASAYPNYLTDPAPNGFNKTYPSAGAALKSCVLCHINPAGGGTRNSFGSDFASASIGNHTFNAALETRDSDGDTFSNITEINAGTFPGDATSKPSTPPPPDTTPPAVTITTPTSSATYSTSSSSLSIGGTASDAVGVTQVTWSNSRGGSGTASGTTSWSASGIALLSGSNVITVSAQDAAGNTGTDTLTVTYTPPPAGDTTAPTVTAFAIPATSSTVGVSITTFTATDDTAVTGFRLTETAAAPAAGATGWSATPPTGYTFASEGAKTLFAWAKDAAGNVSSSRSASVTITLPPPPPPPPAPQDGMGVWVDTWFSVTIQNKGFYVEGLGLTGDRHKVTGYLNISGWDPDGKILSADLHQYDEASGQWNSVSMPLHYTSGSNLNFQVWGQVTGSTTYGFTARIKGTQRKGVLKRATFKTLGGYHVTTSDDGSDSGDVAGWLKITGKMVPQSEVPVP